MYVNIENLMKINPMMLPLLLVLKQAGKKDVSESVAQLIFDDEELEKLVNTDYIKYIKGGKNDNELQRMRLSKKGTEYLNNLDEPEVLEEDIKIFNWLSDIYVKMGKEIGNGKKTQRHIASFREKSGIEKNQLALLCNTFINDESQTEWSFKLEFLLWKPTNLFQTKFNLDDSRLYKYYLKRKEFFDREFKKLK